MNRNKMRIMLVLGFVIICALLCSCNKTDQIKGTWEIEGAYNQESGTMEDLEILRSKGDNTEVCVFFDGQGTYEAKYTGSNGKTELYSGTYGLSEDGSEIIVDNNQLIMVYYAKVATFEDKNDCFILVRKEDTAVTSQDNGKYYLLRRTN